MVLSFVKDLTSSIISGVGVGINYTACAASLNLYFDKYKTIATGLASVGHNVGQVIFAKTIVLLDATYGWRGMMLVHGALTFNMCAFAASLYPVRQSTESRAGVRQKSHSLKPKSACCNTSILKKASFMSFCLSNIFTNIALGVFLLHLPSYSKEAGLKEEDFPMLLAAIGIATIVGKIINSFLGQHPNVNVLILYTASLALSGIQIGLIPVFLSKTGVMILSACVGYFFSVTGALISAIVFTIVGFERFADGMGLSMPFKAFGNLIGGALGGKNTK